MQNKNNTKGVTVQDYQVVVPSACMLGEGPIWDERLNRVLWVDINKGDIHEWSVARQTHAKTNFPFKIGAIALAEKGNLIAATSVGFVFVDMASRSVSGIVDPERHLPNNRFNDGKCDPQGRFWAGTMDEVMGVKGAGALYRLDHNLQVVKMLDQVTCSNGLAWSGDGTILYFIDTRERQVKAFDFDADTGTIAHGRVVVSIPESEGIPDGMAIDNEGLLWVALWGGGKVARWDPRTGRKQDEILLPVTQVTSCAFGGETSRDLYITSAAAGLTDEALQKQPLAGSLFVVENMYCSGATPFRFGGSVPGSTGGPLEAKKHVG